jgi:hypothetical protein
VVGRREIQLSTQLAKEGLQEANVFQSASASLGASAVRVPMSLIPWWSTARQEKWLLYVAVILPCEGDV